MMFLIYQFFFPLVVVAVLVKMVIDGRGSVLKETPRQIRQRMGLLSENETGQLGHSPKNILWIHAASVGEVNAAAPLIKAISAASSESSIVLTTSTTAGLKRAESLETKPNLAVLAPADFYPFILNFLHRVRPHALIIIETELWPAMLKAAARNGVRIAIANGRITERAFGRYRWARSMIVPLLEKVGCAAIQTKNDAARFAGLGLPESAMRVCGNLKNDISAPTKDENRSAQQLIDRLGWDKSPIWVAGSTWPDEERTLITAFIEARKNNHNLKMILAPRHIERSAETARLLSNESIDFVSLSSLNGSSPIRQSSECLLADQIGLLRELYSICDVAFVGGTLNHVGGHNLLEPAIASKPVVFGPHTASACEVAQALESSGGGFRVQDGESLNATIKKLLSDQSLRDKAGIHAAEAARRLAGATQRTFELLAPFLNLS